MNEFFRVCTLSAAILFLELMLIRWIGSEANIFAYLQNTLLICCFTGVSFGLLQKKRWRITDTLVVLIFLEILLCVGPLRSALPTVSRSLSVFGRSFIAWNYWDMEAVGLKHAASLLGGLLLCFIIMFMTAAAFLPLGSALAAHFADSSKKMQLYIFNLLGSFAGTWLFIGASSLHLPPSAWVIILLLLLAPSAAGELFRPAALLGLLAVGLSCLPSDTPPRVGTIWSPYEKLSLMDVTFLRSGIEGKAIFVNNSGYQIMLNLSAANVKARRDIYDTKLAGYSQYDLPFRFNPSAASALILGAGAGNDVAGALRANVRHVTAVEIDPAIIAMGSAYHPEAPYADERVHLVEDDGRAFLEAASKRFDVISFGLLDSHTSGPMTNSRLDHYMYTREALTRAKDLLATNGVMTLTFEAGKPYIISRLTLALEKLFGEKPLVLRIPRSTFGFGGIMLVGGDRLTIAKSLENDPALADITRGFRLELPDERVEALSDDWPYLYLDRRRIPILFPVTAVLVAAVMLLLRKAGGEFSGVAGQSSLPLKESLMFFFLGAGFLLLEAANISRSAVVLGGAWHASAVIISGLILSSLLGTLAAIRFKLPSSLLYALLLSCCVFQYYFDLRVFSALPMFFRFVTVGLVTCTPVIFSGVIFGRAFDSTKAPGRALGMNLLGAVCGALLQSLSFAAGTSALLLAVLAFYALAAALQNISVARDSRLAH